MTYPAKKQGKVWPTLQEYVEIDWAPNAGQLGRNLPVLEQLMLGLCKEEPFWSDRIFMEKVKPNLLKISKTPGFGGDFFLVLHNPGTERREFARKDTHRSVGGVALKLGGEVARNSMKRLGWTNKKYDEYRSHWFPPPEKCVGCKNMLTCLTKGIT